MDNDEEDFMANKKCDDVEIKDEIMSLLDLVKHATRA